MSARYDFEVPGSSAYDPLVDGFQAAAAYLAEQGYTGIAEEARETGSDVWTCYIGDDGAAIPFGGEETDYLAWYAEQDPAQRIDIIVIRKLDVTAWGEDADGNPIPTAWYDGGLLATIVIKEIL